MSELNLAKPRTSRMALPRRRGCGRETHHRPPPETAWTFSCTPSGHALHLTGRTGAVVDEIRPRLGAPGLGRAGLQAHRHPALLEGRSALARRSNRLKESQPVTMSSTLPCEPRRVAWVVRTPCPTARILIQCPSACQALSEIVREWQRQHPSPFASRSRRKRLLRRRLLRTIDLSAAWSSVSCEPGSTSADTMSGTRPRRQRMSRRRLKTSCGKSPSGRELRHRAGSPRPAQ